MGWLYFRRAAKQVGLHAETLQKNVERGLLQGRASPFTGKLEVDMDDVHRWLAARGVSENFEPDEEYASVPEAAKLLGVKRSVVYHALRTGQLQARRTAGGHHWIHRADLQTWRDPNAPPGDPYLSLTQATERFGGTREPILEAVRNGRLPAYRTRDRQIWILPEELERWMAARAARQQAVADQTPPGYISVKEAEARAGCAIQTVHKAARMGALATRTAPGMKGPRIWILESDLPRWCEARAHPYRHPPDVPPGPGYVSMKEAASLLGCRSDDPIRDAIRAGQLACVTTRGHCHRRFWINRSELEAWIEQGRTYQPPGSDYVSVSEAISLSGRDKHAILKAIAKGQLAAVRSGTPGGGRWWIRLSDLQEWSSNPSRT